MGTPAVLSDADFVRLFEEEGPHALARRTGVFIRNVYKRRLNLEKKLGRQLVAPRHTDNHGGNYTRHAEEHPQRVYLDAENGVVLVGSDLHSWPGPAPIMHRAFVKFIKDMKPRAVILNGDVMDFPQISRHPPIGWENLPTVQEEIEAAQERLGEIEDAAGRARKIWSLGNHDSRLETRLATLTPEFAKIHGYHLKDFFPLWESCWSCWINDNNGGVVVKHRFKAGIHAPHNNTMWAGRTIVTGHLHSAKVMPITDWNGTRYGVDGGCLADTDHAAFVDYTEDSPKNWRSAFCVLTFHKGRLLQPELVLKHDEKSVDFRGAVIKV